MKKFLFLLPLLFLGLMLNTSCNEASEGDGHGHDHDTTAVTTDETPTDDGAGLAWEKGGLKVYAMEDSYAYPDANLTTDFEGGKVYPSGESISFNFDVENYELGIQTPDVEERGLAFSEKGQHIHHILNNEPYHAHYMPNLANDLEDGHYVMVAFLARSYHESIKNGQSFAVTQFDVGSAGEQTDLSAPHLVYSRPKSTYTGPEECGKLMLDFYLLNTDLAADGNKVRATINGNEFVLPKWAPYAIEGLEYGEVNIKLELIDAAGNLVPGPFNSVERTVTLQETKPEEG